MVLSALALSLLLIPQDPKMGYTNAQIDELGLDHWIAACQKKLGHELYEYEMRDAVGTYANAVDAMNVQRISALPKANRAVPTELCKRLREFGKTMVDAEQTLAGGGTLYILIYASRAAGAAETMREVLLKSRDSVPQRKVSDVTKRLDALEKKIKVRMKEDSLDGSGKEALSIIAGTRTNYARIAALAAKYPRLYSDRILVYCYDSAEFSTFEEDF